MNITSKKQNYQLWQSGAFGNKLRAWQTIDEWLKSGHSKPVAICTLLHLGNGPCIYDVPRDQVLCAIEWWRIGGVPIEAIMINEMAPDDSIILQGEYLNAVREDGAWGHFLFSRVQAPMRIALAHESWTVHGLQSQILIQSAMTPASYDDWQLLLDQYPDHVFEVSIYDRCLGDCPNRNALVWEIRRY